MLLALLALGCRGPDLSLAVELSEDNALIAYADATLDEPGSVVIELWSDDAARQRTAPTASRAEHSVPLVGLRAERTYQVQAIATLEDGTTLRSDVETVTTGPLPEGIPPFTVSGGSSDGITIVGPSYLDLPADLSAGEWPYLFGVDGDGEVVWYYQPDDMGEDYAGLRAAEPMPDGGLLLIFARVMRHITPDGRLQREVRGSSVGLAELGFQELHHDIAPLPDDHLVLMTRTQPEELDLEAFPGPITASWDALIEVDARDEIIWSWNPRDHLDIERWPIDAASDPGAEGGELDWTHANSVVYDEETDQLIVSLRNQHWVIAIERATGEIAWKLGEEGDFSLEGGEWFSGQHAASLVGPGEILLYDNGPLREPPATRAVSYRLDEAAGAAEQSWAWEAGSFASRLGDADRLPNGNTLVCVGGEQEDGDPRVVEVTPEGQVAWQLTFEDDLMLYRAQRVQWLEPAE